MAQLLAWMAAAAGAAAGMLATKPSRGTLCTGGISIFNTNTGGIVVLFCYLPWVKRWVVVRVHCIRWHHPSAEPAVREDCCIDLVHGTAEGMLDGSGVCLCQPHVRDAVWVLLCWSSDRRVVARVVRCWPLRR